MVIYCIWEAVKLSIAIDKTIYFLQTISVHVPWTWSAY